VSDNQRKKRQFLADNPLCCFCGGSTASVETDHVPGRVFFRDRHWPVGYEFPACVPCNRATRRDEQAVAMLARVYPDPPTESERAAVAKLIQEVGRNHPGLLEEMQPSIRQLREAASEYGLAPPPGKPITELPVLSVAGPLVNGAVEQFSRKLFCALFYKHTGQILGPAGGIATRWYSNVQINADEIAREIALVTPFAPNLERNAVVLDDQFFYRWGITDSNGMGAFLTFFRRSFAIFGVVALDTSSLPEPTVGTVLRPFSHTET